MGIFDSGSIWIERHRDEFCLVYRFSVQRALLVSLGFAGVVAAFSVAMGDMKSAVIFAGLTFFWLLGGNYFFGIVGTSDFFRDAIGTAVESEFTAGDKVGCLAILAIMPSLAILMWWNS